jgi:tetratricopeptide (TPR) repeat protein
MSSAPTAGRASALNGFALLNVEGAGEAEQARAAAEEALSIYTRLADQWGIAYSHLTIAEALSDAAKWKGARDEYQEARRLFLACEDEHYFLVSTRLLAWMYFELGEFAQARATHEENLERARRLGHERIVGTTLGALGEYDIREWNLSAALPKLIESWEIFRALNHPFEIAVVLCRLAWVLARSGRPEPASQVLARSLLVYDEISAAVPAWIRPTHDEIVADIRSQIEAGAYEDALRRGRLLSVEQAVALALEHTPA